MAKKQKKRRGLGVVLLLLVGTCFVLFWGYHIYKRIFYPNIDLKGKETAIIYIPSQSSIDDVYAILEKEGYIENRASFRWVVEKKNYQNLVKAGRYTLTDGMSNQTLVNMLRSGDQTPVKLTLTNCRTKADIAGKAAAYLEADSVSIIALLNDEAFANKYGFTKETISTLFILNTYEFYWNTDAEGFIAKMAKEYKQFWNEDRKAKARDLNLTQSEVSILASIVQAEQTVHADERPMVAGLYINRLKKGMRLDSDPTLVFASGDFSINRVLDKHKKIDSPYNTYRHKGLPPGPINVPEISSIDAVLNYKEHNYIFMCAKDDFSGYHYFSSSFGQHQNYANRYQRELNKRRIMR